MPNIPPADWIKRAQIITLSWDGLDVARAMGDPAAVLAVGETKLLKTAGCRPTPPGPSLGVSRRGLVAHMSARASIPGQAAR